MKTIQLGLTLDRDEGDIANDRAITEYEREMVFECISKKRAYIVLPDSFFIVSDEDDLSVPLRDDYGEKDYYDE